MAKRLGGREPTLACPCRAVVAARSNRGRRLSPPPPPPLNRTYVCIAVAYAPNLDVARAILRVCPISESVIVWNTLKRRRDLAMGRWLLAQGWNPHVDVQWLQMWSPARAVWIQSVVSLHARSQKSSSSSQQSTSGIQSPSTSGIKSSSCSYHVPTEGQRSL